MDQPLRRVHDSNGYEKVQALLDKMKEILGDEDEDEELDDGAMKQSTSAAYADKPMSAFTVRLNDPAGNSFIEFVDSMADPKWNLRMYQRTLQQNVDLGLVSPDEVQVSTVQGVSDDDILKGDLPVKEEGQAETSEPVTSDEIFVFPGPCSSCGHPINTLMKKVNIPYFKVSLWANTNVNWLIKMQDILIMSTNCEHCGYRDNEVKSGSAISEKGKRITLKVEDEEDLSRDILKVKNITSSPRLLWLKFFSMQSETAGLEIPEIDLVLTHGTLGGRFTTLEGILDQVYEELSDKMLSVAGDAVSVTSDGGDSRTAEERARFEKFLSDLKAVKSASRPFTLIVDDPLANSYVQNLYAPDLDPNMTTEWYERTWDQNEELGLNDMKV